SCLAACTLGRLPQHHAPVILCLWPARCSCTRFALTDLDSPDQPLRLVPDEIDGQKTVAQVCTADLDAIRQYEGALELPSRDPPIEKVPALLLLLLAADRKLIVLDGYLQLISCEACHRQRDAQNLASLAIFHDAFDVVGRIAVAASLPGAIDQPLDLLEAEQHGTGQKRHA